MTSAAAIPIWGCAGGVSSILTAKIFPLDPVFPVKTFFSVGLDMKGIEVVQEVKTKIEIRRGKNLNDIVFKGIPNRQGRMSS